MVHSFRPRWVRGFPGKAVPDADAVIGQELDNPASVRRKVGIAINGKPKQLHAGSALPELSFIHAGMGQDAFAIRRERAIGDSVG